MREHLFRGYSEEYGWVYGDNSDPNGNYPANIFPREDTANYDAYEGIAVDPETVCEFTGLTDKNGTKIFEGDILEFINTYRQINNKWKCVVEFLDGAFICRYIEKEGHLGEYNHFCSWSDSVSYEVIGNIFDNPELIGGEENG